jgi:L-lactate dehydrogenase (cytochrome)
MVHGAGEQAVARAAQRRSIPYALSSMGATSLEDVRAVAPLADHWLQVNASSDRGRIGELVRRAANAAIDTLVVTADVPVPAKRLRDARNGLSVPPALTLRGLAAMVAHPRWCFDLLSTEPIRFANFQRADSSMASELPAIFDASATFDDVEWLRGRWDGSLVVKGVLGVEDAKQLASIGVNAIVVSNHGGRQLDRTVAPLDALPAIVAAVPSSCEVLVDGGIRSGADVAAAVSLGARACLVGRPYLYGLMAGGRPGVTRAIDILVEELVRTMQLLGARSIQDLGRSLVASTSD